MSYQITFTPEAEKSLAKYKKSNPNAFKKVKKLMPELAEHPRTGTGHPEPLISGNSVTFSRRISGKDRLIYDIYDDVVTVLILSMEGHYKDK
ncbi:MAG: Txe/YoeB family addiction module toxin [Bacteroidales bacterium]|nr:Txe/YoeB family addiction module toxin [Bacteroidales bacterium]